MSVYAIGPTATYGTCSTTAPLVQLNLPAGSVRQAESTLDSIWLRTQDGRVWRVVVARIGVPAPLLRPVVVPMHVSHIACGTSHVLLVGASAAGTRVYAFGDNSAGQCCMNTTAATLRRVTLVPSLSRLPLRRVYAGSVFGAAVLTHGGVAIWGGLQAGGGGHPRVITLPASMFAGESAEREGQLGGGRFAGGHVVDAAVGDAHFVVATSSGQCFDFAAPSLLERDAATASQVPLSTPGGIIVRHVSLEGTLWGTAVARVAAAGSTSYALSTRGQLFSWGWISSEWACGGGDQAVGRRGWRSTRIADELVAAASGVDAQLGFFWSDKPVSIGGMNETWAEVIPARLGCRPGFDSYATVAVGVATATLPSLCARSSAVRTPDNSSPCDDREAATQQSAPDRDSGDEWHEVQPQRRRDPDDRTAMPASMNPVQAATVTDAASEDADDPLLGDPESTWLSSTASASSTSAASSTALGGVVRAGRRVVVSSTPPPDSLPVPSSVACADGAASASNGVIEPQGESLFSVPVHGTAATYRLGVGPGPERARAGLTGVAAPWALGPLLCVTAARRVVPLDGGCQVTLVSGAATAFARSSRSLDGMGVSTDTATAGGNADSGMTPAALILSSNQENNGMHLLHELLPALWVSHVAQARGLLVVIGTWDPVQQSQHQPGSVFAEVIRSQLPSTFPLPISLESDRDVATLKLTDSGDLLLLRQSVVANALAMCGRLRVDQRLLDDLGVTTRQCKPSTPFTQTSGSTLQVVPMHVGDGLAAQVISLPPGWALSPSSTSLRNAWQAAHAINCARRASAAMLKIVLAARASLLPPQIHTECGPASAMATPPPVHTEISTDQRIHQRTALAFAAAAKEVRATASIPPSPSLGPALPPKLDPDAAVSILDSTLRALPHSDAAVHSYCSATLGSTEWTADKAAAAASKLFLVARLATLNSSRESLFGGVLNAQRRPSAPAAILVSPLLSANNGRKACDVHALDGDFNADALPPLPPAAHSVLQVATTASLLGTRLTPTVDAQRDSSVRIVLQSQPPHEVHARVTKRTLLRMMATPQQVADCPSVPWYTRLAARHALKGRPARTQSSSNSGSSDDGNDSDASVLESARGSSPMDTGQPLPPQLRVVVVIDTAAPQDDEDNTSSSHDLAPEMPRFDAPLCWWERDAKLDALCSSVYEGGAEWRSRLAARLARYGTSEFMSLAARPGAVATRAKRARLREALLLETFAEGLRDAAARRIAFAHAMRRMWPSVCILGADGKVVHWAHLTVLQARAPLLCAPRSVTASPSRGSVPAVASDDAASMTMRLAPQLHGYTHATITTLMQAAYTGDVSGVDVSNASEVLSAAARIELHDVAAAAENELIMAHGTGYTIPLSVKELAVLATQTRASRLMKFVTVMMASTRTVHNAGDAQHRPPEAQQQAQSGETVSTPSPISTQRIVMSIPTLPPPGRGRPSGLVGIWAARRAESLGRTRPPNVET